MIEAFLEDTTRIRWSQLSPEGVRPAVEKALAEARARIGAIAALKPEEVTLENTFLALESAADSLDRAWGRTRHLMDVQTSDALRAAFNEMLPQVTEFFTEIPLNADLWRALKAFAESPAAAKVSPIRRRLMEEKMREFRHRGADLAEEPKKRLAELEMELAQKTQKFSENVLDATNAWDLVVKDEAQLAGLPEVAKEGARESARSKGLGAEANPAWRFTLHAPSVIPALEFLESEDIRRQIWTAHSRIGRVDPHRNTQLIWDILRLRQEKAELLGKPHFADHVLEPRMAKNGQTALTFTKDLFGRVQAKFLAEIEELEDFKARRLGTAKERLQPWEIAYWSEKLRREKHGFDSEELRPYLPIESVINGMFRLCEELFGVQVVERPAVCLRADEAPPADAVEVWDREVKFYELRDEGGDLLGCFYADWHPRESKRSGAWMNYLRTGLPPQASVGGKREPHVGLICGNLTPATEGKPALLTHDEVETIFHEFGHLLHHLLGDVEVRSLNGIDVAWDFVELPSQIMENFCHERACLDRFARHYQTGEPIPEDLFQKMKAARNFQIGLFTVRQLGFGKMDLELHMRYAELAGRDLDEAVDEMLAGYVMPTKTPRPNMSHSFGHLFSDATGYAAGYYSYKWAEVLDADAFTKFQEDGVISPRVGREFRRKILSQGNAREPGELFRDFMGRDPKLDALLIRGGLAG